MTSLPAGYFVENAGQLDNRDVLFYTDLGDVQMGFGESSVLIKMVEREPTPAIEPSIEEFSLRSSSQEAAPQGALVRLSFGGANTVVPKGREPLSFMSNFFIGSDPAKWRQNVKSFREIAYDDLYDGIDLIYRMTENGVKYDLALDPGKNPGTIVMSYEGILGLSSDSKGDILIHTAVGDIRDTAPIAYQQGRPVDCFFTLHTGESYGLGCAGIDDFAPLIIDPLVYATFLGGTPMLTIRDAIAVDSTGHAYVALETTFPDFPVTPGAFDTTFDGSRDILVVKLSSDGGSLVYGTYLGGSSGESSGSITLDSAGYAYLTGRTESSDFPVTSGIFDTTLNGTSDAFLAKLGPTGDTLFYSTFLGGGGAEYGVSVAVDSSGNAYVAGWTNSSDFPVTSNAYDIAMNGADDLFVAKLDPTCDSLLYATYFGGSGEFEWAHSIAVDSAGNAFVTGAANSPDFPVTSGSFDETWGGEQDAFVVKLDTIGGPLVFGTYIGGDDWDEGRSIAVDPFGSVYITGHSGSYDFPVTAGAFQESVHNSRANAFVLKLEETGSSLVYSTLLGGEQDEYGFSIALDSAGNAYVAGYTNSPDFPVTPGALDTNPHTSEDGFVAKLNTSGDALIYGTYLGGNDYDRPESIALDLEGNAYVAGCTGSADFPVTPHAFKDTLDAAYDVFVVKLNFTPNASPSVTMTSPTGGEHWEKGSDHTISWSMQDNEDADANLIVYLNYSTGGITYSVAQALKGQENYQWTLPDIEADDVVMNITVIDTGGMKGWAQSNPFTISASLFEIIIQYWWLLATTIVAVIIVILALVTMKRRRKENANQGQSKTQPPRPPPTGPQ